LRSMTDESEFRRTRLGSPFFGESDGSANMSRSWDGRDLLPCAAARLARIASSCEREGRWPEGPLGGTFSERPREILSVVLDLGGGGRIPLLLGGGLSFNVSSSNSSAAFPVKAGLAFASAGNDILSGDVVGGCGKGEASRNGFRDTGRGGGSRGDVVRDIPGDAARLRNGLLDGRFKERPGEVWRYSIRRRDSQLFVSCVL
jgi:hypothetical protein